MKENEIAQRAIARAVLRSQNIDIEVQVVTTADGFVQHTGQYRFIVSYWNDTKHIIKNYYSPNKYDSYEQAEAEAIRIANERVM